MALKDDIAILTNVPVFAGLEEEQIRLLAFGAEKRTLSKDQVLFREGSPADSAFAVISGTVVLTSSRAEAPVEAMPGSLISELAMISDIERKFTATATEDCELIRIPRSLFRRLLEEYPEAASVVQARIQEKLDALVRELTAQRARLV